MLEGFCNGKKLEDDKDKYAMRVMDELFTAEKQIGEIAGGISLNFKMEPTEFVADQMEVFEKQEEVVKKPEPQLDEEGNPIDPPAEE